MFIPPPTPPPYQHALVAQLLQHALAQPPALPGRGSGQPLLPGLSPSPEQVHPPYQGVPDPASVFGRMRQALPDATRSGITSHQQALILRFMRNAQASAGRGVGK